MRLLLAAASLIICAACSTEIPASSSGNFLYVWAGDSAQKSSDFLAVIDANPKSATYGSVITSLPVGEAGTFPHHTEAEMPKNDHLLANGFGAGRTWLFDLSVPRQPKILTSFGDLGGLSHPHTYTRMTNGNVLATFQYAVDSNKLTTTTKVPQAIASNTMPMPMPASRGVHMTGGLVEMDERGTLIRRSSAVDTTITDRRIYPYSVLALPAIDRAISTTTDMDPADSVATDEWIQFWKLTDLSLINSVALKPGPRGNEQKFTGEPRLLPDGKSVYIHTFNCGLYIVRNIDSTQPTTAFVRNFEGKDCGVPILTGHYWLQPVPALHGLVALDISDPEHPREVSTLKVADDEEPHWIAIDATGRRVVLNSAGALTGNRVYVINFDPASGKLSLDEKFRDLNAPRPGVSMTGKTWPHGFTGKAIPHGTVFSR